MVDDSLPAEPAEVRCARCVRSRSAAPAAEALAWVMDNDSGAGGARRSWLCPTCARAHVRDIEGKLPAEYW